MSNTTVPFDPKNCTIDTCSVKEYGQIQYIPSLAGNALYLGIFLIVIIAQSFLGIKFRTWGFMVAMIAGSALEIVGYAGRLMLHNNIFDDNAFILYLIGVTIGPAFYTAAIYLCLGRIITILSVDLSWLKPRTISILFVSFDFFSLVLQAAGGAIASTSNTKSANDMGINLLIAGLAVQVLSLAIFAGVCSHFAWKVLKNKSKLNPEYASLRMTKRWKGLLIAMAAGTLTIFVRSVYRLIELQQGFDGQLANDQVTFMLLEGPMIFVAVISLTIWHPGYVFGRVLWVEAGFHLRTSKEKSRPSNLTAYKEVGNNSDDALVMGAMPRRGDQHV